LKGYRVFFSRISLEDKLGTEYEPYIFAALNSAKIMLAFGSDYDYYNAVWVKNEWSRFLHLMEKDKEKHLIPCYKDIDAYDMPKEFTRLQAQDMGKVGAIQDLARGIDKLMGRDMDALKTSASGQTVIQHISEGGPNAASLTARGNMFLEDGKFGEAEQYFDRALDIDPKSAEAYLGLFMSGIKARNRDVAEKIFVSDNRDPSRDKNWNRAKEFATKELLNELNLRWRQK
jgi:tetratricopeptide (TPR) repeat protein